MKFTSVGACFLCLTLTSVFAFPEFRQKTDYLPEVKSYCNSVVLNAVLHNRKSTGQENIPGAMSDDPDDFAYVTSGVLNGFPIHASGFAEELPFERTYKESRLKRSIESFEALMNDLDKSDFELMATDNVLTKVQSKLTNLRNACIANLLQNSVFPGEDEREDETNTLMGPENYREASVHGLFKDNMPNQETSKRAGLAEGLNPTGWRKRRSGEEENNTRLQKFLRNVRQLLQKRKRLEFNPTGW